MAAGVVRWGEKDWGMAGVMERWWGGGGGEGKGGGGVKCEVLGEGID